VNDAIGQGKARLIKLMQEEYDMEQFSQELTEELIAIEAKIKSDMFALQQLQEAMEKAQRGQFHL
jgi:hypothetical protein